MLGGGGSYAAFSSLPSVEEDAFNERVIDEDEYFYVVVDNAKSVRKNDKLDYLLYARDLGPGQANGCKIAKSRSSTEDLYCMLDVLEGDLFLQDIELEYSVPKGMCNYLEFKLPWHYNQKIGLGPEHIYSCGEGENAQYYDRPLNFSSASISCEEGTQACSGGGQPTSCVSGGDIKPNCASGEAYCSTGTPASAKCEKDGSSRTVTQRCDSNGQPATYSCTGEGESFVPSSCDDGTLACVEGRLVCKSSKAPVCSCPSGGKSNKTAFCNTGGESNPEENLDRSEEGLANCCFGMHEVTEYKSNQTTGGFDKSEGKQEDWGGVFHQCIGGLAKVNGVQIGNISGPGISFVGVPAGLVEPAFNKREQENYTIPHIRSFDPISIIQQGSTLRNRINRVDKRKSLSLATCWGDDSGPEGCKVQDDGWPDKMYIADDISLRNLPGVFGHPFMSWSCLDAGYEVRHRIHLIVREWNTEEEFLDYQSSEGSNGDANYSQDSDACDYYSPDNWISPEPQCNDLQDVEDLRGDYPEVRYCKYKLDDSIQADNCSQAR